MRIFVGFIACPDVSTTGKILGEPKVLVHKVCRSQLIKVEGKPVFCDVCAREVKEEEIEEVDDSPGPFSG